MTEIFPMTTSNPKNAFQCRTLVLSLITGAILAAGFEFSSFQENLLEAKDQAKIDGIRRFGDEVIAKL